MLSNSIFITMKRNLSLFLLLGFVSLFVSCTKEKEEKWQYEERTITAQELESGTGTFCYEIDNLVYYVGFKNGLFEYANFKNNQCEEVGAYQYSISGDKLTITKKYSSTSSKTCYLKILWVKVQKDKSQLYIFKYPGTDDIPYKFHEGYYDKSDTSMFSDK